MVSRQLVLTDPARSTGVAARGAVTTSGRPLTTTLWYPSRSEGRLPVIVFSHGFGSSPEAYSELLTSWAKAGYLVAAPRFPLTSEGSALELDDVYHQPADVSFVLRQVIALDTTAGDALAGRIDQTRVAVAGHSAGAVTTLGMLDPCCAEPLVDAIVLLAPTWRGFGADFVRSDVPVLVVHGAADATVPLDEGRAVYAAAPGPKALVELRRGTHSAPFDTGTDADAPLVRSLSTLFLDWSVRGRAAALAQFRDTAAQVPGSVLMENQPTG